MDVTVAVATFGHPKWERLARKAIHSVINLHRPYVYVHLPGGTLAQARNQALEQVTTEWVCHLDGDDELEMGFFDYMSQGQADIRAPAVRYQAGGPARIPTVAGHSHQCEDACLFYGNWLVVGSLVRAELVRKVGGWKEYPVYEDFDLWQRCWLAGATFEAIPQAVYRAHVLPNSRNRSPNHRMKCMTHYEISKTNMPDENWEYLRPR
jgi:glycosyltransferase involved in cell wall biosynthesis